MNKETIIGKNALSPDIDLVALQYADRRNHVHIIGKTGVGKTTLVRNMLIQHIAAGDGVGIIDPHGDLAESLLDYIPKHRTDDLIYFNPADTEHPVGLNVLSVKHTDKHLVASGIRSALKSIWSEFWGPRMDYIFLNALLTLLEVGDSTLMDVPRILNDDEYRSKILKKLRDPVLWNFWINDFETMDRRQRKEAISPIENKIGQFISSEPMRNIVGQATSKLDFAKIINGQPENNPNEEHSYRRRFIFIANLSKGQLGDDKTNLLGALLITQFKLAAMQRATIPEEKRNDFFLFVDEFQNFCTDSFEEILSEARKYRLNLTLSHQYIDQLTPKIRSAVFGNIGTLISFRIGHTDAEIMEREFGKQYIASQFSDLNRYDMIMRPLIKGADGSAFRVTSLPPINTHYGHRENMIRCSREKYARNRIAVEKHIDIQLRHGGSDDCFV
ncbi:MAG: type IV secretory system conjugative DNA transfer family protein [Flavobacteriaceae bacterium]